MSLRPEQLHSRNQATRKWSVTNRPLWNRAIADDGRASYADRRTRRRKAPARFRSRPGSRRVAEPAGEFGGCGPPNQSYLRDSPAQSEKNLLKRAILSKGYNGGAAYPSVIRKARGGTTAFIPAICTRPAAPVDPPGIIDAISPLVWLNEALPAYTLRAGISIWPAS